MEECGSQEEKEGQAFEQEVFLAYAPYATAAIVAAGVVGVIHAVISMVRGED